MLLILARQLGSCVVLLTIEAAPAYTSGILRGSLER